MLQLNGQSAGPLFGPPLAPKRRHSGAVRRRKVRRAKAAWSSWTDMAVLKRWARVMTTFHNETYVVDHIVPLSSEFVCGLHCIANLAVITKAENDRKQNRWWPDMWGEQEVLL